MQELFTQPLGPEIKGMARAGGLAAIAMLVIMLAQVIIFIIWPPPGTVEEFFNLFDQKPLLGLLSMDLLYLFNNALLVLIYLALYAALRHSAPSAMLIALVLGLVGIAAYYASNTAFEMLSLSRQYAVVSDDVQKAALVGAGQGMLAIYKGTAFTVYYILNAVCLLIMAVVMLRSRVFSRATGRLALVSAVLMSVPSTAGAIGMVFALASLVPWGIFLVLIARRLLV